MRRLSFHLRDRSSWPQIPPVDLAKSCRGDLLRLALAIGEVHGPVVEGHEPVPQRLLHHQARQVAGDGEQFIVQNAIGIDCAQPFEAEARVAQSVLTNLRVEMLAW